MSGSKFLHVVAKIFLWVLGATAGALDCVERFIDIVDFDGGKICKHTALQSHNASDRTSMYILLAEHSLYCTGDATWTGSIDNGLQSHANLEMRHGRDR